MPPAGHRQIFAGEQRRPVSPPPSDQVSGGLVVITGYDDDHRYPVSLLSGVLPGPVADLRALLFADEGLPGGQTLLERVQAERELLQLASRISRQHGRRNLDRALF